LPGGGKHGNRQLAVGPAPQNCLVGGHLGLCSQGASACRPLAIGRRVRGPSGARLTDACVRPQLQPCSPILKRGRDLGPLSPEDRCWSRKPPSSFLVAALVSALNLRGRTGSARRARLLAGTHVVPGPQHPFAPPTSHSNPSPCRAGSLWMAHFFYDSKPSHLAPEKQ
jgi:hypothetical protein